ncbi:MAG: thioredoxin domain-containing protein [Bacteroidetes bacterium]|nr:thioredoxin domain-containing protein [Bacteroidota bacterium]
MQSQTPNQLINETSPYLLQHAYNPVQWVTFSPQAFEEAKKRNKLILISIGYSACHWCHVMEHESFNDKEVATLMNTHFINIKVDREERTDVDMLYMQAVQLMTGQGGWPLNCFVLPNGKPVYGGTYFKKEQWIYVLKTLTQLHLENPEKMHSYANELTKGIKQNALVHYKSDSNYTITKNTLEQALNFWQKHFDIINGGPNRAPKFPLPNNYLFLMRYAILQKENTKHILNHVELTLQKMAFSGLYDQLRGGFSRYSTDIYWKVPHFEKMLYDNAQLCSLYTEAFTHFKNPLYKKVATETLNFIKNEWLNSENLFYTALDADSENEEGKYYVWKKYELEALLNEDYNLFAAIYNINETGYWENDNYILTLNENLTQIQYAFQISANELENKIQNFKLILLTSATKRIKPKCDNKSILSWNALTCSAYCKAYLAFNDTNYKQIALNNIKAIEKYYKKNNTAFYRIYNAGKAKIDAFLEDYAFLIEAYMNVYLITQNETFLYKAKAIADFVINEFSDENSNYFYYTNLNNKQLIANTIEIIDNVIPSSNSQMALNLFFLSHYFNDNSYLERSKKMLSSLSESIINYGSSHSNWAILATHLSYLFQQITIVGKDVDIKLKKLYQAGLNNAILAVSETTSNMPLLKNRYVVDETNIFVCKDTTCAKPVSEIEAALKIINLT